MPLTRAQKEELLADYQQGLVGAPHVFLLSFHGISVPEVTELRTRIRQNGGRYQVIKNRIASRAIEGAPLGELEELLQGPTAVVYGEGDPVALAKALTGFAKETPKIDFKGGLVDGKRVAAEEIREIATMPSREDLLAKLVFLLQSPVTRFVRSLAELPKQLVVVLEQVRQGKE